MSIKINFYIQPNSSENKICGLHDGAFKVKLKAAPVDCAANKALIEFLAQYLNLSKKNISVVHGELSRRKVVLFDIDPSEVEKVHYALNLISA